jgi:hypothetical protein
MAGHFIAILCVNPIIVSGAQKCALWPGFTTFHDTVAEKNPQWEFEYRMRDERTTPKKIYWICCQGFKRNRPLTRNYT